MRASLPRFLLLGGALPERARAGLTGVVEVVEGSPAGAEGGLIPAKEEALPALRRYREGGGRLPVFAVTEEPFGVASVDWLAKVT